MKIALIGADGQLGTDLVPLIPEKDLAPLVFPDFDVTRPDLVRRVLGAISPRLVINTAAFNRVDEGEDDPEGAFRVNAFAVRDLAVVCRDLGAVLVHFSTDYVFDGRKTDPYVEEDAPNPQSVYASSKLAGESFARNYCPRHFVIRTCGLYGRAGSREKGTNFVETVLSRASRGQELRVVDDQTVTPTSTAELAPRVLELVETGAYGLYHMTNEGRCTWFEFASAVLEIAGLSAPLSPISSAEFGAKALRPSFSVLENAAYKNLGLTPFSSWKSALEAYLRERLSRRSP